MYLNRVSTHPNYHRLLMACLPPVPAPRLPIVLAIVAFAFSPRVHQRKVRCALVCSRFAEPLHCARLWLALHICHAAGGHLTATLDIELGRERDEAHNPRAQASALKLPSSKFPKMDKTLSHVNSSHTGTTNKHANLAHASFRPLDQRARTHRGKRVSLLPGKWTSAHPSAP